MFFQRTDRGEDIELPNSPTTLFHDNPQSPSDDDRPVGRQSTSFFQHYGKWAWPALSLFPMLIVSLLIMIISLRSPLSLPTPADVYRRTEFNTDYAMSHLEVITAKPHPINSEAILLVGTHIVDHIESLISSDAFKQSGRQIDVSVGDYHQHLADGFQADYTNVTLYQAWHTRNQVMATYVESRNIVVRVRGTGSSEGALLISAHFDSASTSFGAYDDGIAVAVILELLRLIVEKNISFKRDVIFLLGNGEEANLLDSHVFSKHPWFASVDLFINIEAGGVGVREMMFRSAGGGNVAGLYANGALYPHMTNVADGVFNLGLIQSDTNFRTFALDNGLRGIDMAFYEGRERYHTKEDNIKNVLHGSVARLGGNLHGLLREFGDAPKVDSSGGLFVYHDILGGLTSRFSVAAYYTLLVFLLTGSLGTFGYSWMRYRLTAELKSITRISVLTVSHLAGTVLLAIIIAAAEGAIFSYVAPVSPLRFPKLVFVMIVLTCNYPAIQLAVSRLSIIIRIETRETDVLALERWICHGTTGFWICVMLLNITLSIVGYPMLYFVNWFSLFQVISYWTLIPVKPRYHTIEETTGNIEAVDNYDLILTSLTRCFLSLALPLVICLDISLTLVAALAPNIIEYMSPIVVFVIISFFSSFMTIPFAPLLVRKLNRVVRFSIFFSGIVLAVVLLSSPQFTNEVPNRIYAQLTLDLDRNVTVIDLQGNIEFRQSTAHLGSKFRQVVDEKRQSFFETDATDFWSSTTTSRLNIAVRSIGVDPVTGQRLITGYLKAPWESKLCVMDFQMADSESSGVMYMHAMFDEVMPRPVQFKSPIMARLRYHRRVPITSEREHEWGFTFSLRYGQERPDGFTDDFEAAGRQVLTTVDKIPSLPVVETADNYSQRVNITARCMIDDPTFTDRLAEILPKQIRLSTLLDGVGGQMTRMTV